jgi:hypothetical protein
MMPDARGRAPRYDQKPFDPEAAGRRARFERRGANRR